MCKRLWSALLVCALVFSCTIVSVGAAEIPTGKEVIARTTGQLNHTIPANTLVFVSDRISLDKDESIRYNCTYTSKSASVDFGYVDPDGAFCYVNCTSGSIYGSLKITKAGEYKIAIRNNASYDVTVTGNIRY